MTKSQTCSPQFLGRLGTLAFTDFERYPVWIGVRNFDLDKPWYEKSNEATFRPWTDRLPAPTTRGMVLVSAILTLRDSSTYSGYIRALNFGWDEARPPRKTRDGSPVNVGTFSERHGGPSAILGLQQPKIFIGDQRFSFWGGVKGIPTERRQAFYAKIGKPPEDVFPLTFDRTRN